MSNDLIKKIQTFQTVLEEVPEIRYAGDPILRQMSHTAIQEECAELAGEMKKILLRYRKITGWGRGLAAPQIGVNTAMFITFVDDRFDVFMNPKIVEKSNKTNFFRELCMSAGVLSADVERPDWIIMEWTDEAGAKRSERIDGFKARLYQHEEAHLRGRLNLDDASPGGIGFISLDPLKEQLRDTR